jgi:hypothetical protein
MASPLIPQEIYLLERYGSLEYFGRMRDEFGACVRAAEQALAEFMKRLPANYRKLPTYDQPDQVWGERIIPNLQWALRGLNDGYVQLSRGDADALGMAGNVNTSFASIARDYTGEWMPQPHADEYERAERVAWCFASNISHTQQGNWSMNDLTSEYTDRDRGPLDAPPTWPIYRLNPAVRVKTGEKVPCNGVYLPDASASCAQFLIKGYEAWETGVMNNPDDPNDRSETRVPTTWTLVERIADSGGGVPGAETAAATEGLRLRCEANQPCPREGWWVTLAASTNNRRHFKTGELMPDLRNKDIATIWYWSERQGGDA